MAESSTPSTRVIWLWQSNVDPYDNNQKKEWKRYSDLQIHRIEEMRNKEDRIELGEYIIDFNTMTQYRKGDEYRQRPIRPDTIVASSYLREDRFGIAEKPREISKSFGEPGAFFESSKIIEEWKRRYKHLCNSKDYSKVIEQANEGILCEAEKEGHKSEGDIIVDMLSKVKYKPLKQVHDCCTKIYSMETFLYKVVNQSLRNQDEDKVDTLGAYCYLLLLNLYDSNKENSTLYRGCYLTDEIIEDYRKSIGKQMIWSAFTSLSRSQNKAQKFGNALFIVRLTGNQYCSKDLANLSLYPDEEEVLLRPAHPLWVEKVGWDEKRKKPLIYMNDDPDYRPSESDRPSP